MLLAELEDLSLEEEGIHRDPKVLGMAARMMTHRNATRYRLNEESEPCCRTRHEPFCFIWHLKEEFKLSVLQQKVSWTWWLLEKKQEVNEKIASWFRP